MEINFETKKQGGTVVARILTLLPKIMPGGCTRIPIPKEILIELGTEAARMAIEKILNNHPTTKETLEKKLRELEELRRDGIVTEEEYRELRKALIRNVVLSGDM